MSDASRPEFPRRLSRSSVSDDLIASVVERWIHRFVLPLDLCPFAVPVVKAGRYAVLITEADPAVALTALCDACDELASNPSLDTLLLVVDEASVSLDDFLDMQALANALLEQQRWQSDFTLVAFHPHYLHAGIPVDSPLHYSNRAPYPILQLLRNSMLETLVEDRPDLVSVSGILEKNSKTLETIGSDRLAVMLNECVNDSGDRQ